VISTLVWADFWPTRSTDCDLQDRNEKKKANRECEYKIRSKINIKKTRPEENQFLSKFTFSCCYWLIALNVHFTLLLVFSFWFLARAQENIKTGWKS